jgi:hypothetical protein
MNYIEANELDHYHREVLFLILADQCFDSILGHMGGCARKLRTCNRKLMKHCCEDRRTNIKEIYWAGKMNETLCKDLSDEFGHRYSDLVGEVLSRRGVQYERIIKDGVTKSYVSPPQQR